MTCVGLLVALAAAACSRDSYRLETSGDSEALVAVRDAEGRVDHTDRPAKGIPYQCGPSRPMPKSSFSRSLRHRLIDAQHRVISDKTRRSLELVVDPETLSGSCGRCLSEAGTQTHIMLPGQSCRIPHFTHVKSSNALGEGAELVGADRTELAREARKQLRLRVPGDCACDRAEFRNESSGQVCVAWPPVTGNLV